MLMVHWGLLSNVKVERLCRVGGWYYRGSGLVTSAKSCRDCHALT